MTPNKSSKNVSNKNLIDLLIQKEQEIRFLKVEYLKLQMQINAQSGQSTITKENNNHGYSNNSLRRNLHNHS